MARQDKFTPELYVPKAEPTELSVVLKCHYGEHGPGSVVSLEASEARRLIALKVAELA